MKEEQRGSSAVFLVCKEERVCLCGKPLALKLCVMCNVCNMQELDSPMAPQRHCAVQFFGQLDPLTRDATILVGSEAGTAIFA